MLTGRCQTEIPRESKRKNVLETRLDESPEKRAGLNPGEDFATRD